MEGKWLSEQGVRLGLEGGSARLNSTWLSSQLAARLGHQLAAVDQLSPQLNSTRLSSLLAARLSLDLRLGPAWIRSSGTARLA